MDRTGSSTPKLSPRFDEALQYAFSLHATQVRKGTGIPYMAHLMSVAALADTPGGVSSCYHGATRTPRTRSTQEHNRSVQILGFLWG